MCWRHSKARTLKPVVEQNDYFNSLRQQSRVLGHARKNAVELPPRPLASTFLLLAPHRLPGHSPQNRRRCTSGGSDQDHELLKVVEPATVSVFEQLRADPGKTGVDNLNIGCRSSARLA